MVNGNDFAHAPLIGKKPQRVAMQWDNSVIQRVAADAKTQLENAGGGLPMVDPIGFMATAALLQMVTDLKKQVDHLTGIVERLPRAPGP